VADTIPPIFRSALDEPAPPDPPEDEGAGDDDGEHRHLFLQMPVPIFAVYSDGSVVANEWRGTLIQGWCWGASLVTADLLWRGVWGWIGGGWVINFRDGLFAGPLTVVATLLVMFAAGVAICQPTRLRRLWAASMLMAAMFMVSVLIVRGWWLP
jgi:hypothetical protein